MKTICDRPTKWYLEITNALADEHGQGLVEYALIIAVVGVVLAGALVALRGGIGNTFNQIVSNMQTGS